MGNFKVWWERCVHMGILLECPAGDEANRRHPNPAKIGPFFVARVTAEEVVSYLGGLVWMRT